MSFLKLNSISGLPESLISGKNAALEDCLSENEVKWWLIYIWQPNVQNCL